MSDTSPDGWEDLPELRTAPMLGHDGIDQDHARVAAAIDRLLSAASRSEFSRRTNDLIEIWRDHCAYEEALMQESGYPDFEAHRKEHRALSNELAMFLLTSGRDGLNDRRVLFRYLWGWFEMHSDGQDSQLAAFLNRETR
ncbi:MAG: hypothetical protein GVY13_19780 [Alphaproteobacteria bacterium]|jgi:hemerythrin|nr:hypothetical protein [Alphaproteobacteria bacterium]